MVSIVICSSLMFRCWDQTDLNRVSCYCSVHETLPKHVCLKLHVTRAKLNLYSSALTYPIWCRRLRDFHKFSHFVLAFYLVVLQQEALVLCGMGSKTSRTARYDFNMSSFVSEFIQELVLRVKLCNITRVVARFIRFWYTLIKTRGNLYASLWLLYIYIYGTRQQEPWFVFTAASQTIVCLVVKLTSALYVNVGRQIQGPVLKVVFFIWMTVGKYKCQSLMACFPRLHF